MYTPPNMYGQPYQNVTPTPNVPGQGAAIASMVCGILSIVFCWCYGILGLVLGIVGMALSGKSKRDAGGISNGMAKTGFICGLIGTIFGALFLIYIIFVIFIMHETMLFLYGFGY